MLKQFTEKKLRGPESVPVAILHVLANRYPFINAAFIAFRSFAVTSE